MKIDRVKIENFKSLKNIKLELVNLTLLTGINSTGKSSFIQALLLLKQNQFNLEKLLFYKESEVGERVHFNFDGNFVNLENYNNILFQDSDKDELLISLFFNNNFIKLISNNDKIDFTLNLKAFKALNLFNDGFQYVMTDRISPQKTYLLSKNDISNNLIGHQGEFVAHYLDENRHKPLNIKALLHPKAITEQFLENVSLWLGEISSGIDIIAKKNIGLNNVELLYQYTYGNKKTNELSPLNVGFGVTYVLPIIVSILKAKPDDLLIIENPESHLHPAGQAKIAQLCALASEAGVQIIVETHSDHFLNGLRVATKHGKIKPENSKIYYFEKKLNELETNIYELHIDKNGKINENWPDGFFDEYRKQLDELLW